LRNPARVDRRFLMVSSGWWCRISQPSTVVHHIPWCFRKSWYFVSMKFSLNSAEVWNLWCRRSHAWSPMLHDDLFVRKALAQTWWCHWHRDSDVNVMICDGDSVWFCISKKSAEWNRFTAVTRWPFGLSATRLSSAAAPRSAAARLVNSPMAIDTPPTFTGEQRVNQQLSVVVK
jgi:hypothetical protein